VQSWQVAASPCWTQVLPDVISAHPSRRAWTPTPAARGVHSPVASPTTSAFPPLGQGRRPQDPCSDFSTVAISGLQSFLTVQARRFARHPGRSYRCARPQGSRDFYVRASRGSFPPHAPDMLAVRIGQLTAGDSHPIRCAALSAAPLTATPPQPRIGGPRLTARVSRRSSWRWDSLTSSYRFIRTSHLATPKVALTAYYPAEPRHFALNPLLPRHQARIEIGLGAMRSRL